MKPKNKKIDVQGREVVINSEVQKGRFFLFFERVKPFLMSLTNYCSTTVHHCSTIVERYKRDGSF